MTKEIDNKNVESKYNSKKHSKINPKKKNKNSRISKDDSNKKNKNSTGFYYSFLTIVLLIFLSQVVFSAILNITKNISYQAKIATIKKSKAEAEEKNRKLKKELKDFSTTESLEAIARNNLKMAGDDEVLIIINEIKKQTSQEEEAKKKKGFLYEIEKFMSNDKNR